MPTERLRWKKVSIVDDRSGPLAYVKCAPNLAAAVRAAETFQQVAVNALERPDSPKWRKAAMQLLESRHCSIEALAVTIGVEAMTQLMEDTAHLLQWMFKRAPHPPKHLLSKVEATRRKSVGVQQENQKDKWKDWYDALLDVKQGMAKGHRWANAPNAPEHSADLGKTKNGRIDPEAHLTEQCSHFGGLWKTEDKSKQKEMAEVFKRLRNATLEARLGGWESLSHLKKLVALAKIRHAVQGFKTKTSTGLCGLQISRLRDAPDAALAELGALFEAWMEEVLGPSAGMDVALGLLAKKQAGFRTICTFSSAWRIFMACMSPELRKWDVANCRDFDSAVKGRSASSQVMRCGVGKRGKGPEDCTLWKSSGTSAVSTRQ